MVVAGVVLAGGAGRRMGGLDKAALQVGGIALLDRVLDAARPVCDRLLVVGPTRQTDVAGVDFVSEAQPGGPVPAILAGVDAAGPACEVILVMAVDLPLLSTAHLRRLVAALDHAGAGAAASADEDGPNPLLAAYRVSDLSARVAGVDLGHGDPARRLLPADPVLVDLGAAGLNVNRPEDLAAAEILAVHDEEVVVTIQWLRGLVRRAMPEATETVDTDGHRFSYRDPAAGDVCSVVPCDDDVQLAFSHGSSVVVRPPTDPAAPKSAPETQ